VLVTGLKPWPKRFPVFARAILLVVDMNKSPAFQFYPQDYLSSARVAEMTLEEEGVYIRLLCYCWSSGSIPADSERCARLAGKGCSIEVVTTVQRSFNEDPADPERLVHDRLDIERNKQNERREQASMAGRLSGKSRAEKANQNKNPAKTPQSNGRSTDVQLNGNTSSSSSSSTSTSLKERSKSVSTDLFDSFWDAFSKKTGKDKAEPAFAKACKNADPLTIIEVATRYADAFKADRTYQKYPTSWLNGKCWNDEPSTWPAPKNATTVTTSIWPAIVQHLGRIDPYKDYSEGIAAKFGDKALAAVKSIGVPNINQANEYQASVLAKRFGELMK
jgi:uncharacterized protein YdaU (DUF1376 family)